MKSTKVHRNVTAAAGVPFQNLLQSVEMLILFPEGLGSGLYIAESLLKFSMFLLGQRTVGPIFPCLMHFRITACRKILLLLLF